MTTDPPDRIRELASGIGIAVSARIHADPDAVTASLMLAMFAFAAF
ncbi:hypothetical protein [Micromonospora sp. CP22]|nr:hypothetical protein [Micromonospora sp. CP22]